MMRDDETRDDMTDEEYLKGVPKVYVLMMDPQGYACEEFWLWADKEYTSPRVTEGIFMVFGAAIRELLGKTFKISDYADGTNYQPDDEDDSDEEEDPT